MYVVYDMFLMIKNWFCWKYQYNTINSQIDELSNNQDLKQQQQELLQHQLQELEICI
jgi:DNA repair ATPase RecN